MNITLSHQPPPTLNSNPWTQLLLSFLIETLLSLLESFFDLIQRFLIYLDATLSIYVSLKCTTGIDLLQLLSRNRTAIELDDWLRANSPRWVIELCDLDPLVEKIGRVGRWIEIWRRRGRRERLEGRVGR